MTYNFGGFSLSDFTTYQKAIESKAVWCWCKGRHLDQCDKIDTHILSQLILTRIPKE